jgi:hypothetical protein
MKRAVAIAVALLAVLATAAPAAARPLQAKASLSPPVQLFGNTVTAQVSVIADTTRVDPARLRVTAKFAPYAPIGPPEEVRAGSGRYVQTTWTWNLRCLTAVCVPVSPPSDVFRVFKFGPAHVSGVGIDGKTQYGAHAFFPQLEVLSQVSPGEKTYIESHKHIEWMYQVTPAAGDAYRLPPGLVFWLAIALAGLCGAGAIVLAGRWALRFRAPLASTSPAVSGSYLERALALFFWANARGDETLQRKALERVADELPLDDVDLSHIARELAWSPETPEGEAVEAISQHAGVQTHPDGGTDE